MKEEATSEYNYDFKEIIAGLYNSEQPSWILKNKVFKNTKSLKVVIYLTFCV